MAYEVEEFLALGEKYPIVDVRTPAEFEQGHIPGAYNIPLFSNEERVVVGTLYKNHGKQTATIKGLEFVGPKMSIFAKRARKLAVEGKILLHCWRGGMRSSSMAWLFKTIGLDAETMSGGYKAYRRYIRSSFELDRKMLILGGLTGSGKTDILKELEKMGEQFLDLEGVAHHRGSSFGQIGQGVQPTNEQFENNLAVDWLKMDANRIIWLEDESKPMGRVRIMDDFYERMRITPLVVVEMSRNLRVPRLVDDYASLDIQLLEEATQRIGKRIGGQNLKDSLEALQSGDFAKVANITLDYYDKTYSYGIESRKEVNKIIVPTTSANPKINADLIMNALNENMDKLF
ncbi:MAG: tRNA 2-selenouridine(34) synthase MnmH [Bacteroidales bacterium]|nr:tRNA 2-selenouridine(34) synthase MnmH [Bacteroidales bacterium]